MPNGCLLAARTECVICGSGVAKPGFARRPNATAQAFHAAPRRSARYELRCRDCATKPDGLSTRTLDRHAAYLNVCGQGHPTLSLPGSTLPMGWGNASRVLGRPRSEPPREATLIDPQMVFAAEFAAIGQVLACLPASTRCRYACSVNASSIPHDLVVLTEPSTNRLVDALPNAG